MLARVVNHKWDACSSKNSTQAPVHPHIKLSMYRTWIIWAWWKLAWRYSHVSSGVLYLYKRLFWPVLCHKRIGLPCCTLFTITVTCLLQIILLSNYLLPLISVLAGITLLKTTCHFLLLLVGFNTLTYQKDYDWSPILLGHQVSFLRHCRGVIALGKWKWVRKN